MIENLNITYGVSFVVLLLSPFTRLLLGLRGVHSAHDGHPIAEHGEQLTEWDADLQHGQRLQPVQSLLLNLGASVDKPFRHEIVHLLSVEAQWTHVSV